MRYDLLGTEGAFFAASGGPFAELDTRWYRDGAWSKQGPETVESEYLNAADNFAAAVRTGVPLTCPGRDGRCTQAVLDAMYRSAYGADGGWVDVVPELK